MSIKKVLLTISVSTIAIAPAFASDRVDLTNLTEEEQLRYAMQMPGQMGGLQPVYLPPQGDDDDDHAFALKLQQEYNNEKSNATVDQINADEKEAKRIDEFYRNQRDIGGFLQAGVRAHQRSQDEILAKQINVEFKSERPDMSEINRRIAQDANLAKQLEEGAEDEQKKRHDAAEQDSQQLIQDLQDQDLAEQQRVWDQDAQANDVLAQQLQAQDIAEQQRVRDQQIQANNDYIAQLQQDYNNDQGF